MPSPRMTTVLLLALAAAVPLAAATLRGRALETCSSFDVSVSECTVAAVQEAVGDACEFPRELRRAVRRACNRERRQVDKGEDLRDALDYTDAEDPTNNHDVDKEFLESFYSGGTHWNDGTGVVDQDAPVIAELYDESAESSTLGYPNYLPHFGDCELPAVMCLWVRDRQPGDNNGNCARPLARNCFDADPADNTDLCYTDASRLPSASHVPAGIMDFPGELEGDVHAHGFAWKRGSLSNRFKGNLLFYVSMYDHLDTRGYANAAPGSAMCACLERMPTVSRADCTEIADLEETWQVTLNVEDGAEFSDSIAVERTSVNFEFAACSGGDGNDLYDELVELYEDEENAAELDAAVKEHLAGECANADE